MFRPFAAYLASLFVLILLDLVWLGFIAKPLYQQGIGHLMADRPRVAVAALFYAIYALGLMVFVVVPHGAAGGWSRALAAAALFGFFAYATYDLTNLATLKEWPLGISLLDICWGTLVSTASGAAGKFAFGSISEN